MRLFSRSSALALGSLGLVIACGSPSTNSGFDNAGSSSGANGNTFGGSSGTSGGGSSSGSAPTLQDGGAPNGDVDTSGLNVPTQLGCASRAQQILILDFRSGWWAGGGGGAFSGVALPAVAGACPETTVDYHHFETVMHAKCVYKAANGGGCQMLNPPQSVADIRSSFEQPSVDDYTQIWVLSGSDQDQSDIPVGDQLFQGVLGDTKGACIPMLVAAGDGFMTHANTITNDLGMGNVFTQQTNPPSFFSVQLMPAQAAGKISGSALDTSHVLFTGVSSITDNVASLGQAAKGDSLADSVPAPNQYKVVAHDAAGHPAIAVGASKLAGDGYRPFIFDAGWQRMYTLGQDPGTSQYLKNIVMYLSLVGCKAAPIGPPK